MGELDTNIKTTSIKPISGWQVVDLGELLEYKDLFYFLVWRDIKSLYAQTILGFMWAILEPSIQIIMFTIIFGKIAKIPTDDIPYFLYATLAVVPWTYMSTAMSMSGQSLVSNQGMLGKIYFPRLIYPIVPVLSKLVDFGIALIIVIAVILYYKVHLTWNILYLPLFLIMMVCIPAGVGMWLSALAIRFRDVRFVMGFVIRMLMYTAPIVYSASAIDPAYRLLYSLNPIVGVIEGFRSSLLGTEMHWMFILPGMVTTAILLVTGALYFRRLERVFVDVS
jgi:homopolymeric O-antigen transport system permease protein